MNADQEVQIQPSVNPVSQAEAVPPAVSGTSAEGFVEATHKEFRPPEGLEIMQPVETPNLSGVSGTGAQEHPPLRDSVDGSKVKLPEGIVDLDAARKLSEGSPDIGLADSARATERQLKRAA